MGKREKLEKINRIISAILMMFYVTSLLPAKEISSTLNASRQRMDYYLEKAGAEYDEAGWEEKAAAGFEEALKYWEKESIYIEENDYEEYKKQKEDATLYLELEKNKSYVEWLCRKAAVASASKVNNELAQKIKETRATYNTDGYSLEETSGLRNEWNKKLEIIINEYLDKIDSENLLQLTEIKNRLTEKGVKGVNIEEIFENANVSTRNVVKLENEQLLKTEGNKLIVRFLEDRESIKAEKTKESAKIIAREISDKALTESNVSMDRLFSELEKTVSGKNMEEADVSDLLANFKVVFNKGLKVWEDAEIEFLKNRKEWENEAEKTFQNGEEKWQEAYNELRKKRTDWEKSITEKINKIQDEVARKNKDNANKLSEMYKSYNVALEEEKSKLLQIAESQVALYGKLRNALVMCKQGIESWYGIWESKYKGVYSYWKTEDNEKYEFDIQNFNEEKAKKLKKDLSDIVNSWQYKKTLKGDLSNLEDLIISAEREAENAVLLKNLRALKTADDWINQILYYKEQIKNVENNIYNLTENVEDVSFKSELEIELAKTQQLVQYWEEELYVAQQVEQYAKSVDASRDSSEKTKTEKEQAEKDYDKAQVMYEKSNSELEYFEKNINENSIKLNIINDLLDKKRKEIAELNTEYQALMALDQNVDIKTVTHQIKKNINDYEEIRKKILDFEKEMYLAEYSLSQNSEYEKLKDAQSDYIDFENRIISSLSIIKDSFDAETNGYYNTIYPQFEKMGAAFIALYEDIIELVKKNASNLDAILSSSEYSGAFKDKARNLFVNILKNEIEYIKNCEDVKLNAANGEEKKNIAAVSYADDLNTYLKNVVEILKIKTEENAELIDIIEDSLKDSSKTEEILGKNEKLKTLLSKEYKFSDSELQFCYELFVSAEKEKCLLSQKLKDSSSELDEYGRLYNAEYKKSKYENARKSIADSLKNYPKAENGYSNVIDYVMSLYEKTLYSSDTFGKAFNNYIEAYLKSEAFRYRRSSAFDEEKVKAEKEKLSGYVNSVDVKKLSEEEYQTYTKNMWTLKFLSYAEGYASEYNNWFEKIKKTDFCSSEILTDDDKLKFSNIMASWETSLQQELEAQVQYERKYFEAGLEEIENIKETNLDYSAYEQNLDSLWQLKSSLAEYAEIYGKYSLSKDELKQAALEKKNEISGKEAEYQELLNQYESAVSSLKNSGDVYNKKVEEINEKYRNVLEARKVLRAKQAVYDWAESIYLENLGNTEGVDYVTPKEKLSSVKYAYDRACLSLEILKGVQNSKNQEKESSKAVDFKQKDKLYYDSYIISCEISEKLNAVLYELQQAEQEEENQRYELFGKIDKNECDEETEQWLENLVADKEYFEKVVAATLYYKLFVAPEDEKNTFLKENPKQDEDIYKILEDGCDTEGFPVQGISKAHGNNVGGKFRGYVKSYLEGSYKYVMEKDSEAIKKSLVFRNTKEEYAQKMESLEVHLVKKYAYGKLKGWFKGIKKAHWFSRWFLWGAFRKLDEEGEWASEGVDKMEEVENGANANYGKYYNDTLSSINNLKEAKNKAAEARKKYNKTLTGSENGNGQKIKGSEVKKKIQALLSENVKNSVDLNAVLNRISDEEEYDDIVSAMAGVMSLLKNEADAAKMLMDEENSELQNEQSLYTDIYENEVNRGLSISDEDASKLKKLARMASDLTLTIAERNKASEQYDELFLSLNVNGDKTYLEALAQKTWGAGSYSSIDDAQTVTSLYESYIKGNGALFTDENRNVEGYMTEMLNNWYVNYAKLLETRNGQKLKEYLNELDYSANSFATQNSEILSQFYDIRDVSKQEWNRAAEKLNATYNVWKRDFLKTYQKNTEEWQASYDDFLKDKQEWITTMYVEAANQSAYSEEKTAEIVAKSLVKAKQVAAEEMQGVTIDTEAYINELLADTNLASLEGHMADVSFRLEKTKGVSAVNRSNFAGTMASLLMSQKISSEVTAKMEVTASKVAALKAAENIETNIKKSYDMIDEQNRYYENYVKELVQGAGYRWTSKESKRRVPVDSYVLSTIYETQYVASYQWFKTVVPEVTVSTALLGNMEGETLALAVAQDESDLEEWRKKMFSSEDGNKGEFVKWVGEAGVLKEDYDTSKSLSRNTKESGSGQMGSIILNFQWNEIMQRKGFSELSKPMWDQKLYPGEMFGMEAPSIRTVASVAAAATAAVVGAVAAPFTGGSSAVLGAVAAAAIGAAITFTNEFVFAMLDLVGEYKSPEEIGKQLAIKAATDAVSVLGAGAGAAVSGISGIAGVAARTGVTVATGATSTVATNAIQYAGDWDKFSDSMSNFDTWSGVVTSAAGSLVTNSLNEALVGARYESVLGEGGKKITRMTHSKLDGFNSSQIGSIQNLNGTIGGLASAGLSYGLTGEATFNILNISDFGAGASSGLLEMTLSKDRGVITRLGTGGTDLSFGTVSSSLQGIKNLNKNMQITRAANRNNMGNAATALRTQYGFGDEKQLAQLEEILKGRTELKRGNGDGKAQTVTENGKRTVYLNSYKGGMTREEQFALGITLGHEAYRDGIVGDAQSQFNETAEAVLGHTALAKRMQNDSLYNDMMTGLINSDMNLKNDISAFDYALATDDWGTFGSYVGNNYDYSADYWRVLSDGNIVFDGSKDLYDENGLLLKHYEGSGGYTDSLAKMLGISVEEASSKLHNDYGWNADKKAWIGKSENSSIKTSDSFKAAYDFQVSYADRVWSDFGGSMETAVSMYKSDYAFENGLITNDQLLQLNLLFEFYDYAKKYDSYMINYFNDKLNKQYNSSDSKSAFREIERIINTNAFCDDNYIYNAFGSGGILNPIDSETIGISTKSTYHYKNGTYANHGWGNPRGFAIDLATYGKQGDIVYTNIDSYLYSNSVNKNLPLNKNTGYEVRLFGNRNTTYYGHLQENSIATAKLKNLSNYTTSSNLWRTYIPAGTQIGNVGNTGNSTNSHLHWEYRKNYQYWHNRR